MKADTSSNRYADLHVHSTASDGKLTPTQIVSLAKKLRFSCIAISDHDSINGIDEEINAAADAGIEAVPAVEISTFYRGGEVHVLGYFIDWKSRELRSKLDEIFEFRETRMRRMVDNLRESNIDIRWEDVAAKAGSSYVGRPHIAEVLLEKGYVTQRADAFTSRFIANDAKAYVDRYRLAPEDAIRLIKNSAGVSVLAHPGFYKKDRRLNAADIELFMSQGLQGIEVYHTKHSDEDVLTYEKIARQTGLKISGGSDCHGGLTGEGVLMGKVRLRYEHVQELRDLNRTCV